MGFLQALGLGMRSGLNSVFKPGRYKRLDGNPLVCSQCSHDAFLERRVTLPLDFLPPPFSGVPAALMICHRCGAIVWFARALERTATVG